MNQIKRSIILLSFASGTLIAVGCGATHQAGAGPGGATSVALGTSLPLGAPIALATGASQSSPASLGDGVCGSGLRTYGKSVSARPGSAAPLQHTKQEAIALAMNKAEHVPSGAHWDAYDAAVTDTTSGHDPSLGGPFQSRNMWMVEVSGVTLYSGGKMVPGAGTAAAELTLTHILIAVDDATGKLGWIQACP